MSRPVKIAALCAVGVSVVGVLVWVGGADDPVDSTRPPGISAPEPQRAVVAPSPTVPAAEPRSSASFAPMPVGLDLRQAVPDLRDMTALRRRQQRALDLGLVVDDAAAEDEALSDGYGWPTDRDGIESAIAELRGEVHDCVDGYGPEVGSFTGRVVMQFDVSATDIEAGVAYPKELLVTGTDVPQAIQSCMTSVYTNMPFEPPEDGVIHIDYPVELSFGE